VRNQCDCGGGAGRSGRRGASQGPGRAGGAASKNWASSAPRTLRDGLTWLATEMDSPPEALIPVGGPPKGWRGARATAACHHCGPGYTGVSKNEAARSIETRLKRARHAPSRHSLTSSRESPKSPENLVTARKASTERATAFVASSSSFSALRMSHFTSFRRSSVAAFFALIVSFAALAGTSTARQLNGNGGDVLAAETGAGDSSSCVGEFPCVGPETNGKQLS